LSDWQILDVLAVKRNSESLYYSEATFVNKNILEALVKTRLLDPMITNLLSTKVCQPVAKVIFSFAASGF